MSFLLVLAAASSVCIARVPDGDTIRLCSGERIRLLGIDAPERAGSERCSPRSVARLGGSRNPSWCDYAKGDRAQAELECFLSTGTVCVDRRGQDAYGRTLARVSVNGRHAGEWLIAKGLVRAWR